MSATTTYLEKLSAQHAATRSNLDKQLSIDQNRILDDYARSRKSVDAVQELDIVSVEPILAGFSALPDNVMIESIHLNEGGVPDVFISTTPDVSMASLLMDYPAVPFVFDKGAIRSPQVDKSDEPVYSGLWVCAKTRLTHWESMVGGQRVNIACKTDSLSITPWDNPMSTGAPVATLRVGDVGGSSQWHALMKDGQEYWVQPESPAALARLDKASDWKEKTTLHARVREAFDARLLDIPAFGTAQGKILANSFFTWASTGWLLPSKEDFSAWTPPRGNVLAMHSPQDWVHLLANEKPRMHPGNEAKEKIHMLSARLPNIWRFTDEAGIALLCDAMAEVQTRLQANPSPSI